MATANNKQRGLLQRYYVKLSEHTGIPRILKEAAEYGLRDPELKDFGTSFRITISERLLRQIQYIGYSVILV